ncbi:MAG: hypothetical protein N3E41_05290 [Thermofilaceae archaeon]|nr:hypothetical protein [Thermofilaceae archaeon]
MKVKQSWIETAILSALTVFAVASVKTFFREGLPPGWDHPPHLVCSYLTSEYFLPQLTILGWDPYNNFGWVFNQFYNPGAYILVAIIRKITFVDIVLAYKLALVFTYVLPAFGAYLLAKVISGGILAPSLSALLTLIVMPQESEWLDAGLKQMYYIGMWPQRLGIGFSLLSLAFFWKTFQNKGISRFQLASAAAFLCSAAILSHLMTGLALLASFFIIASLHLLRVFLNVEDKEVKKLKEVVSTLFVILSMLTFIVCVALGLISFWIVPLSFTNSEYHNLPTITWYMGPGGVQAFLGSLGSLTIALAVVSVLISTFSTKNRFFLVSITATVAALVLWMLAAFSPYDGYVGLRLILASIFLLLASATSKEPAPAGFMSVVLVLLVIATGPDSLSFRVILWNINLNDLLPFSGSYAYYKFSGLARYLVFVIAAIGMAKPLEKAYHRIRSLRESELQVGYIAVGVVLLLFLSTLIAPHLQMTDFHYPYVEGLHYKMDLDFPEVVKMQKVMEWVKNNVPENTYVFYQDTLWKLGDWVNLPVSHYFYLSSMISGIPQVGGGYGTRYLTHPLANTETDHLLGQPISWLTQNPERIYTLAAELGISYLVVFDPALVQALQTLPDHFREVYAIPPFYIFQTTTFNSIVTVDEGEILDVEIKPNRISVRYRAPNSTIIRVRQVFYPGWEAFAGDLSLSIRPYYPKIPSYVWVPGNGVIANYKVPFIELNVPAGENTLVLSYKLNTWGDKVSLFVLVLILTLNIYLLIRDKINYYKNN